MVGSSHTAVGAEEAPSNKGVGAVLRARRVQHGLEVRDVAATLRIRAVYLEALEAGRYDQLPGSAYALGFVRTYSEFLGLDGAQMVQQMKDETEGLGRRTALSFPSPAPGGKVPGFWPMVIALLVLGGLVAAWYMWQGGMINLQMGAIPAPPDRLVAAATPANPAPSLQASPATAPETAATAPQQTPQAPANTAQQTVIASVPPPPPPGLAALSQATDAAVVEPKPIPPQPVLPQPRSLTLPAAPPTDTAATLAPEDQPPPPPSDIAATGTAGGTPTAPMPAAGATPVAGEGRVFGATEGPARVVLVARADTWVQVRDGENQALLTRMLKAGESYRVPGRPGLVMNTGNAGGLELRIDGQPGPALGQTGQVRRNVPLDPDRLKTLAGD